MRIAVLGVGLIGGSIGLAARQRAHANVSGWDADPRVGERALRLGAIDERADSSADAVAGADVVFVAAPVGALADAVGRALQEAGDDCVVTDVGSTKRVVAGAAADPRFVGGHPLAGAESAGVEHARADLFDGATWYLTPSQGTTAGVLYERLHRLLVTLGAKPVATDPDTHDRTMACVSHLPHVLANLLAGQATALLAGDRDGNGDAVQLPAVGPSFRDATRVAGANSAIWTDIYLANRDALLAGIDDHAARLAAVRELLAAGDRDAITAWNDAARVDRDALLGAGVGGGAVHELRASVPNRPGVIAEIALALGRAGVNIDDMALSPSADNRQGEVALWIGGEQEAARARELIAGLGFPVVAA
jgi:prephenate dehydrogenase